MKIQYPDLDAKIRAGIRNAITYNTNFRNYAQAFGWSLTDKGLEYNLSDEKVVTEQDVNINYKNSFPQPVNVRYTPNGINTNQGIGHTPTNLVVLGRSIKSDRDQYNWIYIALINTSSTRYGWIAYEAADITQLPPLEAIPLIDTSIITLPSDIKSKPETELYVNWNNEVKFGE